MENGERRGRKAAKQATRERVLAAARDLFNEVGYEEATIRMVAKRAGVSVGSVFTTFASKSDVLAEVMQERLDALYAELDQILPLLRGSTLDRLCSIMAVHYSFEMRRIRLFLAYISDSYSWNPQSGPTRLGGNRRLVGMLAQTVRDGMARGDVRADLDVDTLVTNLVAAYFWNYRLAARGDADVVRLTQIMDRQISVLFAGAAPS